MAISRPIGAEWIDNADGYTLARPIGAEWFDLTAAATGGTTLSLGVAAFGFTPETLAHGNTINLGSAAISMVGNAVSIAGHTLIDLGVAAFGAVANALGLVSTLNLGSAAWSMAAQTIVLNLHSLIQLGVASFKAVGKALTLNVTIVQIITAFTSLWRRRRRK